MTASETLPRSRRVAVDWPREPITIRSACSTSAKRRTASAGWFSQELPRTLDTPRSVAVRTALFRTSSSAFLSASPGGSGGIIGPCASNDGGLINGQDREAGRPGLREVDCTIQSQAGFRRTVIGHHDVPVRFAHCPTPGDDPDAGAALDGNRRWKSARWLGGPRARRGNPLRRSSRPSVPQ